MIRPLLIAALVLNLASAEAIAGPADRDTSAKSLTAQIDGFHGASGTGKTVHGGFASDGGLGTTR
ncbi:hypothetical protein [Antarctobacter heliothermus]|uniref:Uncharacterized protein n=1 Tax=Antarctobacter heliothermus TaxID=74033 RepID=A0A239LN19_9RHOB|nr:hypothetical protein [Antarctobacter heliothermus]SNT30984.1 hypothetical protein SAMN04488078_10947 [Antarctobacter heliothermus]